MSTVDIILLLVAAICFAAATIGVQVKVNLTALGLFCWVLVPLLSLIVKS